MSVSRVDDRARKKRRQITLSDSEYERVRDYDPARGGNASRGVRSLLQIAAAIEHLAAREERTN